MSILTCNSSHTTEICSVYEKNKCELSEFGWWAEKVGGRENEIERAQWFVQDYYYCRHHHHQCTENLYISSKQNL